MGYGMYWANGRMQGYEVPAPCDYPGCNEEINRGLGWQVDTDCQNGIPNFFGCHKHNYEPLEKFEINLEKESKEWLTHVLSEHSWGKWRSENPDIVKKYRKLLEETK